MNAAAARPGGVTLVAVLTWISGALNIVIGVVMLFQQSNVELLAQFGGTTGVITAGIVSIVLGLVIVLVARGLLGGSQVARVLVTIVQALALAGAVLGILFAPGQFVSSLVTGLLALLIIILLYTARANAFFRR
ncbi:DUF7144 family membrane protein [Compostimonas suwonensis]|uniref:DUF7144 domain-containing protein n=1 Tax=Compostimonas suwonensis TaxID=1048394 RepID=A0A2M9C3X8_9MICO|nr:hypothetical protein [Compostimonas suwonensis]PJJ65231.1 hypothetical protein CLV54_0260 [Compostimonas suwonensis]